MILYHFTSTWHLPRTAEDGYIDVTESNLSGTREHAGPDVVWLTKSPTVAGTTFLLGSGVDKTEIRITVDVPGLEAHKWRKWAYRRNIHPRWAAGLAAAGGSTPWYVVERPVAATEWVNVTNMHSGELVDARLGTSDWQAIPAAFCRGPVLAILP
jgi:hypothetical protein